MNKIVRKLSFYIN